MLCFVVVAAGAVFIYMTAVFLVALLKKDNSIVDVAWGPGFILVALVTFFLRPGFEARHLLISVLVIVWGVRLATHVYLRNRGRGEDFRYAKWRKDWGRWVIPRSFLQVFMLQGVFLLIISFPIVLVNRSSESGLTPLDALGGLLWLTGFLFEAVGDYQLKVFKQKPESKGRIMTSGLWKYTRHPNYFGEAGLWWGIWLVALTVPGGWAAIISPLTISFLLLRVSGVTMLEKKYAGNEEFATYARRTSPFFPWFPKKPKKNS
jgi:steroid 5-alpha reductase family enzyme